MHYRPEIDGLRSLAILPVIFFHAGFSWAPGGFFGVDVFFVISGYLITSILIKENQQKRFSLANFYERRARRILPALFFVLLCSTIAALYILSPSALTSYAESLIASVSFVANIYFWLTTNYFNANTSLKPLVHIWSLGIEEQFYFIFPLFFILFLGKNRLLQLLIALFTLSFISALYLSQHHVNSSFYLLHTRAWELLSGAFCAFYFAQRPKNPGLPIKQLGSLIGLVLIILSFTQLNSYHPHPGLITLLPVLGTCLIIIYAAPDTWAARFLSLKPLVWIGLLSYSAYLWHQPLFSFARFTLVTNHLNLTTSLILIVTTFVLAAISWRWIERPFRNRQFLSTKTIFGLSLVSILATVALGIYIIQQKGFMNRYNEVQQVLLEFENQHLEHALLTDACFLAPHQTSAALGEHCKMSTDKPMALFGDSHGSAIWYGLVKQFPLARYSASGCPPIIDDLGHPNWPNCAQINAFNLQEIATQQPQTVILHANWLLRHQHLSPQHTSSNPLGQGLRDMILQIEAVSPDTHIVVIGDVPQWPPSLITLLTEHAKEGLSDDWLKNDLYESLRQVETALTAELPESVTFISLLDLLCTPEGKCKALIPTPTGNKAPITWDYGHLSRDGADFVTELIQDQIR